MELAADQQTIAELRELLAAKDAALEGMRDQLERLRRQVDELLRRMYGRKSERLDAMQLLMEGVILEADAQTPAAAETPVMEIEVPAKPATVKKVHGRGPLPEHLPRHEIVLDVPEDEKVCPATGRERPLIGYETSEKLDYVQETLRVLVYKRAKYGSPMGAEEEGVLAAPMPPELLPRCLAAPSLLARVAVAKFDDHLPLYRQEKGFLRQGARVSRKTMCDWLRDLAQGLRPLERLVRGEILACGVVHHDDTPVDRLDPGAKQTRESRLWVAVSGHGPPLVHFSFSANRKQEHPIAFFRGYGGALMCDEYAGYGNVDCKVAQSCWAHARRYVEKAKDLEPAFAVEVLLEIARLYRIETELKESTEAERLQGRRKRSVPQLEKVFALLESREFRPSSPMAKAQQYILKHRESLCAYAEDGKLPIDNNPAERALRRVAVGRKNWLFLGSETGGETAAVLMTLLGTCRANRINPQAYLADVIAELPKRDKAGLGELLPHRWIEKHPEALLPKID